MGKNLNFKIFLICIGIATLLWLINAMGMQYSYVNINHPINIKLPSKNKNFYKKPQKHIQVQVSGKGWDIIKYRFLNQKPIVINVRSGRFFLTRNELNRAFRNQMKNLVFHKVLVKSIKLRK